MFPITAYEDRVSPAVRGIVKVALALCVVALIFLIGEGIMRLLADLGWIDPTDGPPRYAAEYAVAAIALSYQSQPDRMRRSFARRFVGTTAGVIIGALFWVLPLPTPITVIVATAAGWAAGVYIGGLDVADKTAFFAGATALSSSNDFVFSLSARLAGTFLGFLAVYLVIVNIWPADVPEEPRRLMG